MMSKSNILALTIVCLLISGGVVYSFLVFNKNQTPKPLSASQKLTLEEQYKNSLGPEFLGFTELTTKGLQEDYTVIIKRQITTYIESLKTSTSKVKLVKDSVDFTNEDIVKFLFIINNNQFSAIVNIRYGMLNLKLFNNENILVYDSEAHNE